MKTQIRIFAIAMLLLGISISTFAQVSATATGSATVVTPISITNASNMNFGNLAISPTAGSGTIILSPAGTRQATGGVTLPANTGTVSAASFTVTGVPNYTYIITLPSTPTTISDGNGDNMTVDVFTSDPTPTGLLSASGSQTLKVGATLNVGAAQPAGSYTSATPFTVTVNYN